MKMLMLRGSVPKDRDPNEIYHSSLSADDDMWVHLWARACDGEDCNVVYVGADKDECIEYAENINVWFLQSEKSISGQWDVIFARGGFDWQHEVVGRCNPSCAIYYGAGRRYIPSKSLYDFVLCDSQWQYEKIAENGMEPKNFYKPAAPHFEIDYGVDKIYDICYIANGQQANLKCIEWVYDTVPRNLTVLHLGFPSRYTPPNNVTTMRVNRMEMPRMIQQCRVGIVPYWAGVDSAPRAMIEMVACKLPVVASENMRSFNCAEYDCLRYANRDTFWQCVNVLLNYNKPVHYLSDVKTTASRVRMAIDGVLK